MCVCVCVCGGGGGGLKAQDEYIKGIVNVTTLEIFCLTFTSLTSKTLFAIKKNQNLLDKILSLTAQS